MPSELEEIVDWSDTITGSLNIVIETLAKLAELHAMVNYLGTSYCAQCSSNWPCKEAEIYGGMFNSLSEHGITKW